VDFLGQLAFGFQFDLDSVRFWILDLVLAFLWIGFGLVRILELVWF